MRPKIIVEGTVGAGKTTFINCLTKRLMLEPLYELTDQKLVQILERFYADPIKWGFQLQIYFLTKRFQQMKLGCEKIDVIMDRSIFCDHIFPRVLLKRGEMTEIEYLIYEELHDQLVSLSSPPELMIYLKCSTKTAIDRIKKRGRLWELQIDEGYWETLNQEYEDFFSHYNLSTLLIVDTDLLDENFGQIDLVIQQILKDPKKYVYRYDGKSLKRSVASA
ncbi:deoxynucleoside kinase [Thermotoga profunda]|uniref:deoxynucleoside kinase n=1 Tax=Thermotoga profunda TaxID=1508420 RepID=UPI00059790CB|nr:deoxynucleoside kinase [Thermotoga profunda]